MDESKTNKVIDIKKAKGEADRPYHSKFGNYKPDEDLLQSTARIKSQRDVIQERVHRMEVSVEKVSKSVFDKVRRDYALQLQTINELLNEKKQALKKEIKDLYLRREKLSVEINRHKEILEEAEFRNYLGEFSQSQFQEVENYETKEIEKLESDLSRIGHFIRAHEELFDPQDLGIDIEVKKTDFGAKAPTPQPQTQPQRQPEQPPVKAPEKPQVQQRQEAETPKPAPEPKPEPVTEKPAQPEPQIETNEFEDLFLDDESEEQKEQQSLADSQSNIEKLIADEQTIDATHTDVSDLVSPNEADDYFSQEKVNEDSFTVKKTEIQVNDSQEEATPAPTAHLTDQDQIKTDVKVPAQTKLPDDSISDILNNISFEDKPEEQKEPESKDIPLTDTQPQSEYVFTLVEGEHEQKEFPLKENTSIGRSPSNDIVLKAPKVSRQHAAINMYNNQFIIIDLKSSNGIYVNGAKVDECVLNPGDEISVGGYKFMFSKK